MGQSASLSIEQSDVEIPIRRRRPHVVEPVWGLDVMMVEDDDADTSLILDVLKSNAHVRKVRAYSEPEVALVDLAAGLVQPDLILLDIQMPKINGFRFLEKLRRIPKFGDTQVVFVTTSRLSRDVETAQSAVCGYVIKPDTYLELQTRLDHTIRQALNGSWG